MAGVSAISSDVYSAAGLSSTASMRPCSTMRPRCMTATRSAIVRTRARLWVTNRIASFSDCCEVLEQAHDRGLHRDVEGRGDLVADQHLGLGRERARDRDALALAAGQLVRVALRRARRERDALEQLGDPLGSRLASAQAEEVLQGCPDDLADRAGAG